MKILAPIVGLSRHRWSPQAATQWFLTRSMSTHYDALGLKKNASEEDIKNAYVKLCKKYHPDVSSYKDSAKKFNEIAEAYAVLGNKKTKVIYDRVNNYNPTSYSGGTTANRHHGQHMYRSRDNTFHNVRRQTPPEAYYRQVIFSSDKRGRENQFSKGPGIFVAMGALSVGVFSFVFLVRKSSTIDSVKREKQAEEMRMLITGKSINPAVRRKLDKSVTASKFDEVKF